MNPSTTTDEELDQLAPDGLIAAATAATGLSDLGPADVVDGLTRYTDALRTEAALSSPGVVGQWIHIHRLLVNRLVFEDDVKTHADIAAQEITGPVIITGLPRTGTTKLLRMMATDPLIQSIPFWKLMNPAPVRGALPDAPDPRIDQALVMQTAFEAFPDLMAAHPVRFDEPEEEPMMLEMTFASLMGQLRVRVPSFVAWLAKRSQLPTYEYLRRQLQYLQWQDGTPGRPWLLKSPLHLGHLPEVFAVFPDAMIVHCHRDPANVVPSFTAMLEHARRMFSDEVDPDELGTEILDLLAGAANANIEHRPALPADRILDVDYDEIRQDCSGVISRIYAACGFELDAERSARMSAWSDTNPQHRFGVHQYTGERYGLTRSRMDAAFEPYRLHHEGKSDDDWRPVGARRLGPAPQRPDRGHRRRRPPPRRRQRPHRFPAGPGRGPPVLHPAVQRGGVDPDGER